MKITTGRTAAVFLLWSIWASRAHAQTGQMVWEPDFDFELFMATPDPRAVAVIDGARTLDKGNYGAGVVFHFSDAPLKVCMSPDEGQPCETVGEAVSSRLAADIVAAYGLGRIELRLVVPAVLTQGTPLDPPMGEEGLATTGVADLRPGVKVRLYDRGSFGVAAALDITIPTGGGGANFIGDSGISVLPRALVDFRQGRVAIAGGFGYRWRSDTAELADVVVDDQIMWSIGGEVAIVPKLSVGLSAYGALGVTGGENATDQRPMEAVLSSRYWLSDRIALEAGGGSGVASGIGSPDFRLFAGVRWANLVYDRDHDAIADADDRCPDDPEDRDNFEDADGCPDLDNDRDRIVDARDKCVNDPEDYDQFEDEDGCPELDNDQDKIVDASDKCPNVPENYDGNEDEDGCPEGDRDLDGLADNLDKCPDDPEDKDQFEDEDGCPDLDNDQDKIVDASDKCPNEPETYNDNEDDDGCPDPGKVLITVTDTTIALTDKIFFDYNRARIKSKSYPILNAIASVLKSRPDMRVRVEGHTDDQGGEEFNLKLSQRRAESVVEYLVGQGVKAEQLEAQGFGKSRPLVPSDDEEARAQNRRVEFVIQEQGN